MATYDRAHLVPQAVASFLRQTWAAVELLIVDDGPESLRPLLPEDDRVRHIRVDGRLTIGAKRNLGCEAARGELLATWDDDDWYAPWRIAYQVEQLTGDGADVCGLQSLLYLDPVRGRAWRYSWPATGRPWAHDPTLLFTRDLWTRNPFPDTNMGIDCRLLWSGPEKRIHCPPDERFYVGMIHGHNTSAKTVRGNLWSPYPVMDVHDLIGADLPFYEAAFAPARDSAIDHTPAARGAR
jgi:glycosyltransferase involved in cell wall biosynthesis